MKQDLRDGFNNEKGNRERLLLTMAVPAGIDTIELGFDIRSLNRFVCIPLHFQKEHGFIPIVLIEIWTSSTS